jgi:MFS family permease
MDIAPRYSGSASGMMNFGFGIAGIISPFVFGYLIDRTGSWTLPFAGSICLLLLGAGLAFHMHPDRPFEVAPEGGASRSTFEEGHSRRWRKVKLRRERDPRVNGICDEAVGFDAFHILAGKLEFGLAFQGDAGTDRDLSDVVLALDVVEQAFGFAFISDRGQTLSLSEREESQHHARIERADQQLFGGPDVRLTFELRRAADDDARLSRC